jgi:uncharacterized protein (DUF433 family)
MPTISTTHIELDEKGTARIAGTRSRVINIVLDVRSGLTPEQIHAQYPHLTMAQIHAALAYYYDHQSELDAAVEQELLDVKSLRARSDDSPGRAELTSRIDDHPSKGSR